MRCRILHESRRRLRVHMDVRRMTMHDADILEYYLRRLPCVTDARVYERTADAVVFFSGDVRQVKDALIAFSYETADALVPEETGRALNRQYEERIVFAVASRAANKLFLPLPVQAALAIVRSVRFVWKALKVLAQGRLEVELLDATAVVSALAMGDTNTASSIMFLLRIGEILEEWTHKKSVDDLARTMSLNIDKVWMRTKNGEEVLVRVSDVSVGDLILVHTGNMIPLDGKVSEGEASVEQSSITGESLPVHKSEGAYVYAGTVVEEGDLTIHVDKGSGAGRYDRIVKMIEESEKLKSVTESDATSLADHLVPFSFGGMILTYLLTRNITKALSFIMVDFSCALKLAMPITVLSAMREAGKRQITVKGGKFLETVARADTIVFDKTGTLTQAQPTVQDVVAFGGQDKKEMLRLAACLEEHYPHSMANAVVEEAKRQGLVHEERHTKVEYVVAHGISSTIDGEHVVIGSRHFVFEHEHAEIPADELEKFASLPDACSHLYMSIGGRLVAAILINDPLRKEAKEVVHELHDLGITRIVMMTGDNQMTAASVAREVGVDDFFAEVLPEDKADFIKKEHDAGRIVIMIGDGVNDSPALSEADAGIAISDGAAIARQVADITIGADNLHALVTLRRLSERLMGRVHANYRFIMSFNSLLIALGFFGILPNATSALLHNVSTVGVGLKSMTDLLPENE